MYHCVPTAIHSQVSCGIHLKMGYTTWKMGPYTICGDDDAAVCILVDSIAWSRPYVFWLDVFCSMFEECTGKKAVAICMGGARLLRGDYEEMYQAVFQTRRCENILVCAFGNDVYKLGRQDLEYYDAFKQRIRSISRLGKVGLIFGGLSSIWQYQKGSLYDEHVRLVCEACAGTAAIVSNGAEALAGIQVADRIGHVRTSSVHILMQAFLVWSLQLLRAMHSRL